MAYHKSSNYDDFIYNENSEQEIQITINNTIINPDYIKDFSFDDEVFEGDTFTLGSAIPSKLTLELDNDLFNTISESFTELTLSFILHKNDEIEVIPMNNYIVKERDKSSNDYTKFTLYDYMDKFNKEGFDASNIIPCTRFEFLQALCTYCGVQLENQSIINGDVIVNTYDNSILPRTYLSLISERACGFAKINRNNKLQIKSFSEIDTVELPISKVGEYDHGELKTVSKVVYQNATQIFDAGTDEGTTIFLTQDSPFSCSQEEVNNILQELNGFQYQTLKVRVWGDPAIDTGDLITFGNFKTIAQKHWKFGNGFYGTYEVTLKDGQGMNVSKLSGKTKRKRLESRMDEVEGTVSILSEEVSETTENIAEINLSMNDITNRVSSAENGLSKNNDDITDIRNTVEANQTSTAYQIQVINQQLVNGVVKFDTGTGYTFDIEGLKINKTDSVLSLVMDNDGFVIKRNGSVVYKANSDGNEAENMTVRKFYVQRPIRIEKTKSISDPTKVGIGIFWVGE